MAIQNIRDPGIRQGFSALANAFAPADPQDQARAAYLQAQADLTRQEAMAAQQANTNLAASQTEAQSLFGIPSEQRDEAWRNRVAGAFLMHPDGLRYGPSAATGFTTFTDPMHFGDDQSLSNALIGTGVVSNYANTPEGQTRSLVADAMSSGGGSGGAGKDVIVSPTTLNALRERAIVTIGRRHGVDNTDNVDLGEADELLSILLGENYNRLGNAAAAVDLTLQQLDEHGAAFEAEDPWFGAPRVTTSISPVTEGAPVAPGTPGMASTPTTPAGPAPEGQVVRNPQTGEMLVKRNGQWVPYE